MRPATGRRRRWLLVALLVHSTAATKEVPRDALIRTYKQLELIAKLSHHPKKEQKYKLMEETLESHAVPLKKIEADPNGAEREYAKIHEHYEESKHHFHASTTRVSHLDNPDDRGLGHSKSYNEQAKPLLQIMAFCLVAFVINWKWRQGLNTLNIARKHHHNKMERLGAPAALQYGGNKQRQRVDQDPRFHEI